MPVVPFHKIPNGQIGALVETGGNAISVYMALLGFRNRKSGACFPGQDRLCHVTGLGKDTVAAKLVKLKRAGVIEWTQRQRGRQYGFPQRSQRSQQDEWSWLPPNGFVAVPVHEVDALRSLTPTAVTLYLVLRAHRNVVTGDCYPTVAKLMRETGACRNALFAAQRQLKASGLIQVRGAGRGRRFVLSDVFDRRTRTHSPDADRGRSRAPDRKNGTDHGTKNPAPNQKNPQTSETGRTRISDSSSRLKETEETPNSLRARRTEPIGSSPVQAQPPAPPGPPTSIRDADPARDGERTAKPAASTAWISDDLASIDLIEQLFERYGLGKARARQLAARPGFGPALVRAVVEPFETRYAADVSNPGAYLFTMLEQALDEDDRRRREARRSEAEEHDAARLAIDAWIDQIGDDELLAVARRCADIPADDPEVTAANIRKYRVFRKPVEQRLLRDGLPPCGAGDQGRPTAA